MVPRNTVRKSFWKGETRKKHFRVVCEKVQATEGKKWNKEPKSADSDKANWCANLKEHWMEETKKKSKTDEIPLTEKHLQELWS